MRGFKSPSLRHQPVGIPTGFHFIEKVILRTVENDLDPDRLAYTADNLYDIINDKIGKLQRASGTSAVRTQYSEALNQ